MLRPTVIAYLEYLDSLRGNATAETRSEKKNFNWLTAATVSPATITAGYGLLTSNNDMRAKVARVGALMTSFLASVITKYRHTGDAQVFVAVRGHSTI